MKKFYIRPSQATFKRLLFQFLKTKGCYNKYRHYSRNKKTKIQWGKEREIYFWTIRRTFSWDSTKDGYSHWHKLLLEFEGVLAPKLFALWLGKVYGVDTRGFRFHLKHNIPTAETIRQANELSNCNIDLEGWERFVGRTISGL